MADTQRLAIRKAIATALASIDGVTTVYRDPVDLTLIPVPNMPALALGDMEPVQREWNRGAAEGGRAALSQIREQLLLTVFAVLDAPGGLDGTKDDAAEGLYGAIEAALTPEDYTFGGLVTDLRLRQPMPPRSGLQNQTLIVLEQAVEITFFRKFGVP